MREMKIALVAAPCEVTRYLPGLVAKHLPLGYRLWEIGEVCCTLDEEKFFFDFDAFFEWCGDNERDPFDCPLYLCEPQYAYPACQISGDWFHDILPTDDRELPDELAAAMDAFNAAIRAYDKPTCWYATALQVRAQVHLGESEANT